MTKSRWIPAFVLAWATLWGGQAYGITFWLSDGEYLYELTGSGTTWQAEKRSRPFGFRDPALVNVDGLAVRFDGRMVGTTSSFDENNNMVAYLFDVTKSTGVGFGRKAIVGAPRLPQLSFHGDGTLYGVDTENDVLVEIDPDTGVATPVGDGLGVDINVSGGDLAIPNGIGQDTLFSFNRGRTTDNVLFAINRNTGKAIVLGEIRPRLRRVVGAAFTPSNFLHAVTNKFDGDVNEDDVLFKILRPLAPPLEDQRDLGTIPVVDADGNDLGTYNSIRGDMASRVMTGQIDVPVLLSSDPPFGFIDPLGPVSASNGGPEPIRSFTLTFEEEVFAENGAVPTVDSFSLVTTNENPELHLPGTSAPTIESVDASANPVIVVTLSEPILLGEWTRLTSTLKVATGGSDLISIRVGWLPLDVDQNDTSNLSDATAFGVEWRGERRGFLLDLTRDGRVDVRDATFFGDLWRGDNGFMSYKDRTLPPIVP